MDTACYFGGSCPRLRPRSLKTKLLSGAVALFSAVLALPASAAVITVPLDNDMTIADLRTFTNGGNYPIAPTTLNVGGVPFDLVRHGTTPDSLGVVFPVGAVPEFIITTPPVVGVTKVYTLINSGAGEAGAINAYLDFYGSGGAYVRFPLTQGTNIRDHYDGSYNNSITDPNIVTENFGGGVRLDRQTFELPAVFDTATLLEVRLVGGPDVGSPAGDAFLAGLTLETVSAIPEPGSAAALAVLLTSSLTLHRRRKKTAAA